MPSSLPPPSLVRRPLPGSDARELYGARAGATLHESCEAGECVGKPTLVLVAQLGGGKASLGHGHERLALARFERELELGVEARSVEACAGGGKDKAGRGGRPPKDRTGAGEAPRQR